MEPEQSKAEHDDVVAGLPQPGDFVLGKYRIERVIGRGGMGVVYLALHEALHQRVALKVLAPAAAKHHASATRFINEARAAARIRGDHVASVMDVGQLENGIPYMVLEYLEGSDLSKVLHERGPLPIVEAVDYIVQALSAIAHAHAAGVVHRDLKPGNLFLAERTDGGLTIKVLDFGISKLDGEAATEITHTSAVLGSPGYMSPEQVRSSRSVDGRADIWSLGVILYRLLAAQGPFRGEAMSEVLAAVLEQAPPPLREARPDVPEDLERVIMKCLEKDRDARWATAGELATALAPFASPDGQRLAERIARSVSATSGRVLIAGASSHPSLVSYSSVSSSSSPSGSRSASRVSIEANPTQLEPAVSRARSSASNTRVALMLLGAIAALVLVVTLFPISRRHVATADGVPSADQRARAGDSPDSDRWFERAPKGASDEYALGVKAFRDGFVIEASAEFDAAEKENAWLAAAYLRRSIVGLTRRPDEVRVDFAHAVEHADRLDARDAAVLEAYRHLLVDTPPDDAAWEDALTRLSDHDPHDAELAYFQGQAHSFRGKPDLAIAAFERAIAADPQFAAAYAALAADATETGDLERAKKAVDACLLLPRRSPACSRERIRILSRAGDADGVLYEAEAWIKSDPQHADEANAFKAEAMFALGRALPAVEEAVRQRTRRLPEERSRTKFYWERQLAELRGDFVAAEKALMDQRDFAKESSLEQRDYAASAMAMVEFYEETGRDSEGAAIAVDFLAKEEAWAPERNAPNVALAADPVPRLLAAQLRAKTLDKPSFDAAREAWVVKWKGRVAPRYYRNIWLSGYASIATTKGLADEALAARPKLDALVDPPSAPFDQEEALARVYAMAGDQDRARPHLERAIHALWTLHAVIDETQMEALYGESLEQSDTARACAAYENVLGRWGAAKTSLTAARVSARWRALKCPVAPK
jgi:serine/threonine protein kinase/tetratricopeptide (TPR) repeat protein